MQGVSKLAIGSVAVAGVFLIISMYNATVMTALGMVGDIRPIVQLQSGQIFSQQFADETITGIDSMKSKYPNWYFDGSARVRGGMYDVSQVRGEGLYVGVSDPDPLDGVWSGFFVMTPNDYSSLYHVKIYLPPLPVSHDPANYANLGMYVQTDTATGRINYVACTIDMRPDVLIYRVESGLGNDTFVTNRTIHWEKEISLEREFMDCTLVTNGDNYFLATIDNERVFESYDLNLQMPRPFNAYLETQVTGIPDMVFGRFTDYYSNFSSHIRVIKLNPGQIVSLGPVNATADAKGIARLDIATLQQPFNGTLIVHSDSGDSLLTGDYFRGGDLYSYGPIDWIEKPRYQNRAEDGGKILAE
jgi:hypothetical protein